MTLLDSFLSVPRGRGDVVADLTDRRPEGSELELLGTGRAVVLEAGGRSLLVPAPRGGALGSGAVYARNLPAPGTFVINPQRFAELTQKNTKTYAGIAHPGFSQKLTFRLDKVGLLSRVWIRFDGTATPGAMTPTVRASYPWNLIQRVKLSANGASNLFYCDGIDLRVLERVRRRSVFFDREAVFALPAGGGAAVNLKLLWELPVAYDASLIGAVFAQTEDNDLALEIETPASADYYATNPAVIAGTWTIITEYFNLAFSDTEDGGRVIVLPDIRQLHGVLAKDEAVTAVGEHTVELMRTGGVLLRTLQRWDNAYSTQGPGQDDPATVIANHKFRYGGNVIPVDAAGIVVKRENEQRYGDRPFPSADLTTGNLNYLVDDYVYDNPVRDVVHLLGVAEPQIVNQIAAGTVINAGSLMHVVQEHMVAG